MAARAVLPTDLVALATLAGRVFENEAVTRERAGIEDIRRPIGKALRHYFAFATGCHTWINLEGTSLQGLVSARKRGARTAWEIDCLIDAADDDGESLRALLEQASHDAGQSGVEKLFLRLRSDSRAVTPAARAGFVPYLQEELFERRGGQPFDRGAAGRLGLRRRMQEDRYPLYQLYNAVAPERVRRMEAATFGEWLASQEKLSSRRGQTKQFVLDGDGRPSAYLRVAADGGVGRFDLMVHGPADLAVDLVQAALIRMPSAESAIALVPSYAGDVAKALRDLGFEKKGEYTVLVRPTTLRLRVKEMVAETQVTAG